MLPNELSDFFAETEPKLSWDFFTSYLSEIRTDDKNEVQ